jgi:phenylalanyl-tRNA synthetase beta chain
VLRVRPHPGADRLRLCTVDVGGEGEPPPEVVCGAPNVAEGQVICYARVGLRLPNGMKLKKAKIRGVESVGMICAEDELGIGEDHSGIIVLPADTPIGVEVAGVLGVTDHIFGIEGSDITHRPDLWGHVGFARELGALLDVEFVPPATPLADAALAAAEGEPYPIDIEDEDGCRRYVGIVIENITNRASPASLRYRLESLGQRSIDLLVDLTNLVMLEQGQPLHAFDLRFLENGRIVVRRARSGETMKTLDGEERALSPDDVLIADGDRPVALAGVMGGEDSEVRPDTTAILLEAASFDAPRIRKTAARLGLRTEASSRFEKSQDPEAAAKGARRFTQLLLEHVPEARVTRRIGDAYPRPYPPLRLDLPFDLATRRLGVKVTEGQIRRGLGGLGFVVRETNECLQVDVPTWRATKDVECAEDLVEEIGRIRGYEGVPDTPPVGALTPTRPPSPRRLERRLGTVLSLDLGYAETKNYAFYGPTDAERLGLADVPHLAVEHPITDEQDRMVQTAAANLLRDAARNATRDATGRMWESTRLITPREGGSGLPAERAVLAAVTWDVGAADDAAGALFLSLVEDVRAVLAAAPVDEVVVRDGLATPLSDRLPAPVWLHPGRQAVFEKDGHVLAVVGEAAPAVARAYGVSGRVALAEVDLATVLASLSEAGAGYAPIHRFPVVPFDVAVVVPRRTPAAAVRDVIAGANPRGIRNVALFDVYEGEGIPAGHRSLAFRCELLDAQGTLDTRKADKIRGRIRLLLEKEGWTVRAGD